MSSRPTGVPDILTGAASRGRRAIAHPSESAAYVRERLAEWRDARRPPWAYELTDACEERVHELAGASWPCEERLQPFEEVWAAAVADVTAAGLPVGRLSFGRWDDGDRRLGRLAWCLARHLRPRRVVETGVARGLTTRTLLEGLRRNGGAGRLWSIDLPPFVEGRARETAVAVPPGLRDRWTLLSGSSRKHLPGLLRGLGRIDLFVHDSSHTARNVRFELEQVWPALTPGGAVLIDDVEKNAATGEFVRAHPDAQPVIGRSDDGDVLVACLVKSRGESAQSP
jgi:predicted O-methyltransferase YrrM